MLTLDQIKESINKPGYSRESCAIFDGRDYSRIIKYFPVDDWELFGFKLKDGAEPSPVKTYSRESILADLKNDLEFAFEKALNKRGISSGLMYEVIKMWMWVLEDPLKDFEEYAMYGLPLYKAVALKYGFENPIGNDSEEEYNDND